MKGVHLHSLPIRIWHWVNVLIMIVLIATGIWLRLQGVASLKAHDSVLAWHRCMGWAMAAVTAFWLIHTLTSRNQRRHYRIRKGDFRGVFPQMRFYLHSMFAGAENPFEASPDNKYNPLQKAAYGLFMFFLLPAQVLTGLLFTDIPVMRPYLLAENLIGILDAVHVALAYLIILYFIVHLYMATLGDTFLSHTKTMITGYQGQGRKGREGRSLAAQASPERTTE